MVGGGGLNCKLYIKGRVFVSVYLCLEDGTRQDEGGEEGRDGTREMGC